MQKSPPAGSSGIRTDLKYFFFEKPAESTLVNMADPEERARFIDSILQRTGIEVNKYQVLNIHRIGIEAPASYLFEDLLRWNGDSSCWPNHIARVRLINNSLEEIKVDFLGMPFMRLFNLNALRIQSIPETSDHDNARYLLYQCSGGYPIGIFSMYVRSSIPERGETEMSQLFILVGFNFYGKASLSRLKLLNKGWQWVHNRATTNIAHRFKQLCEWRFEKIRNPGDK